MKNYLGILLLLALVTGCATLQEPADVQSEAMMAELGKVAKDSGVIITTIPSHGAIGDSIAIAAGGGANAINTRKNIMQMHENGGGTLVITSTNPALARVNIVTAVEGLDSEVKNVMLIYAGDKKYTDELQHLVESKGLQYGFLDRYK